MLKWLKERRSRFERFLDDASIDAKDKYTHGHSSRVAEYSRKLAEMNFKSE